MDRDVAKVDRVLEIPCEPKVHEAICCEIMKIMKKIGCILPAIESARPGSSSGIQVLCSLNNTVEKSKLLLHYCSESSKLYLALTAESIALRCERIRTQLIQCLCQIQTMVPTRLASQIAEVLEYLGDVEFIINPKEEEAGKVLSNLLSQINTTEDQEFEAFQKVVSRLNITSSTALLVERRAIKKLLDKFHNVDNKKERILMYFLYLIKNHGRQSRPGTVEQKQNDFAQINLLNERISSELASGDLPPEEFYCINTQKMFENFNPSSTQLEEPDIQALESIHCNSVSSLKNISTALLDGTNGGYCLSESVRKISSLTSGSCCFADSSHVKGNESSNNGYLQLFSWSDDYRNFQSFSKFSKEMYLRFLFCLSELPTIQQAKAMEEIKSVLEEEEEVHNGLLSSGFAEALVTFLKKVCSLSDLQALRSGAQILLALFTNQRWELNLKIEDAVQLLSSFFNCGIDKEALMILQKVTVNPDFVSCIVASDIPLKVIKFINFENAEHAEISMNILSELSSDGEMRSHFLSSESIIEKISQLLSNKTLARFSLNILHNLVGDEEASMLVAGANGCLASMAEVLESGEPEQEESAVAVLLSLCSRSSRNRLLVMKEGVIPSLVNISVNGSAEGRENSLKLLHVLRDIRHIDSLQAYSEPESELVEDPVKKSKKVGSKYRSFGLFRRKMRLVSKSLAFS